MNIKLQRVQNENLDHKQHNDNIRIELNQTNAHTNKLQNELNDLKLRLNVTSSSAENKDKTVEECKNQLTKANELIHQYRLALEDAYKQVDTFENVNKIIKDEVVFLKSELEQNVRFNQTREKQVDYLEADRREKDAERKYNTLINEKDVRISNLTQEMEK